MPRLVVVGGGFAGPSAPDIAAPLRHILRRQRNVRVLLGEVTGIDVAARRVRLADGNTLGYDLLLVASGATHAYFGHAEWAAHAPGLKTLDDALAIRRRLLLAFERAEAATSAVERAAWLHFAVAGGGPNGVELAGTLAEIARHTLASFPPRLQARTRAQLERLGVEVMLGTPVSLITAEHYRLGTAVVPCRTVLWAAGVAASPLGALLSAERDRAGRVKVAPDLSLPGHPEVFAAGDLAAGMQADGKPVPGVAPAAKQMGRHVAAVIKARMAGGAASPQPARAFVYRDGGNLATIGRMAAMVDLRGLQFSGLPAWWFWLAAHVFFLIGFRNRLVVLLNWAWAYWTYQRSARIVLGGVAAEHER